MTNVSHIHVRPLELADFDFVQNLASRHPAFTVPPTYVLWLLLRIKGAICLMAEQSDKGQLGYLLAVPIGSTEESLFVWQLATSDSDRKNEASTSLLTALRDTARKKQIQTIAFSVRPGSAVHRLITKYTNELVAKDPHLIAALPPIVTPDESEYLISLD